MNVLIIGSIALDSVKTPYGVVENSLGGSAIYGSVAANFFAPVRIVGVIGEDFPKQHLDLLKKKKIDIEGLQIIKKGFTFRWSGVYDEKDLNSAITLKTDLNVFANFHPILPDIYKNTPYVFLGNIHPALQLEVLQQLKHPKFVMLDSMNLWIQTTRNDLLKVIEQTDLLLLNEGEAKMLCETTNLILAAQMALKMGPKYVIIKKGENGAMLFSKDGIFLVPAFPIDKVIDPTGAGDSFAGGLIGFLASKNRITNNTLKQSIAVGSTVASFNVQEFSLNGLLNINKIKIKSRLKTLKNLTHFEIPQ